MYTIIKNDKFLGFSLKEEQGYENIEITEKEHREYIDKQSEGFTLYWNTKKEQLETIKLNDFEHINDFGEILKDTEAELKHYKDLLLTLKKEKVQLKKDIRDFEEFGEETAELVEQLKLKENEISELDIKIKNLEG